MGLSVDNLYKQGLTNYDKMRLLVVDSMKPQQLMSKTKTRIEKFSTSFFSTALKAGAAMIGLSSYVLIAIMFSWFLYVKINHAIVPDAIVNQPLHFDTSRTPAFAQISLQDIKRPWTNQRTCSNNVCIEKAPSILKNGYTYDVFLKFDLASSDEAMREMLVSHTTLVDSVGKAVAKSSRSIAAPYRSDVTRFLDGLLLYPLRLLRLPNSMETVEVSVTALENFLEQSSPSVSTDKMEVELLGSFLSIQRASITITPHLWGLAYFFYNFPTISALVFVSFLTGVQVMCLGGVVLVAVAVSYLKGPNEQLGK